MPSLRDSEERATPECAGKGIPRTELVLPSHPNARIVRVAFWLRAMCWSGHCAARHWRAVTDTMNAAAMIPVVTKLRFRTAGQAGRFPAESQKSVVSGRDRRQCGPRCSDCDVLRPGRIDASGRWAGDWPDSRFDTSVFRRNSAYRSHRTADELLLPLANNLMRRFLQIIWGDRLRRSARLPQELG